jgi:hypothetical protein
MMTVEQFVEFAKTLPQDIDRNKVAKALGVQIPVVIAPLAEQLAKIELVKHTPKITKKNPSPQETTYVAIPSIKLSPSEGCRGFWINTKAARAIASQILAVCDKNSI